jgi:serine/threonine-protein kinase
VPDQAEQLARLKAALADRYTIERHLGQGGMATVYRARDRKHDRLVAIKVLRPELAATLGADRFLREIQIAAKLHHPHILALYDSGEADGFVYYVMPLAEGETLRERLNRDKQLPVEEVLRIAREVADALRYAHEHDVIHRDVKPENIMLESRHAVVTDFGIARAISEAGGERLTETGLAVGTPAYMSPEQAAGSTEVDQRSDVYALACVVYEMLAGEPPFTGPTAEVVLRKHITAMVPDIQVIRSGLPPELVAALSRALAKTPADRFSAVTMFADALDAAALRVAAAPPVASTAPRRRRRLSAWSVLTGIVAAVVIAGAVAVSQWMRANALGSNPRRAAIAVLPFQNRTVEESQAYFASGLYDELLTQLAKVAALKVISRTSVLGYAGTTKPLHEIADELGVGTIVEGSVQVEGERLRVNVRLVDVDTDEYLWAEGYDRTVDDLFTTQSEIARHIVRAVGAALTEAEARAIATAPTDNDEAYRFYLQGEDYRRRPSYRQEDLEIAQQLYERALTLDPDFALARAALSGVHGLIYLLRYDPSAARAERQREEADAALRLAPGLPQAHFAMGYVYYVRRDFRRALEEFAIALQGLPNDAELWSWTGYAHRRLGNWQQVFAAFERAAQLNPRDPKVFQDLGGITYRFTHRYGEAVRAVDRALALDPGFHMAAVDKGWIYVEWHGELDTLREALDRLPQEEELGVHLGSVTLQRTMLLLWGRQADSLLGLLATARSQVMGPYAEFSPASLYAAWAYQVRGDPTAARAAFDSARVFLDSVIQDRPNEWAVRAARGLALAGLGWREEALGEARWLEQSIVYREDAFFGPLLAVNRAWIMAQAGAAAAALDEIERLLTVPSFFVTGHMLRLDPRWDPIRNDARFQALLVKYAN